MLFSYERDAFMVSHVGQDLSQWDVVASRAPTSDDVLIDVRGPRGGYITVTYFRPRAARRLAAAILAAADESERRYEATHAPAPAR